MKYFISLLDSSPAYAQYGGGPIGGEVFAGSTKSGIPTPFLIETLFVITLGVIFFFLIKKRLSQ